MVVPLVDGRPVTVERVVGWTDWGVEAALLAVVTEALTLMLALTLALALTDEDAAEEAAEEAAGDDAAGAELEPSHLATDGPGAVYAFPPLSGWPEPP